MYYLQTKASFTTVAFFMEIRRKMQKYPRTSLECCCKNQKPELEQEGQTRGMVVDFG